MAEVTVVEQAPGTFTVTITSGSGTTTHTVRVPDGLPATLGWAHLPTADLVRRSFTFLLEREPPSSILRSFSLEQISDYFPDYMAAIRRGSAGQSAP
jgi:hypothetical protein